jgi:undecaprenyl-diphosphatase
VFLLNILEAVILGLVQGIAEFIPISSSGHLLLFSKILGLNEPNFTYEVLLHVATLIPVLIIFKKEVFDLIKNPFQSMTYYLIIATIPAVIMTLVLGDKIDFLMSQAKFLPITFIITGVVLIYSDKLIVHNSANKKMTYMDALIIGIIQSIAITPGISRSGSTIAGGLSRKLNREEAAKFSFLLSIPAIAGALTLQIMKVFMGNESPQFNFIPMIIGFLVASLSGYLAISFMLNIIRNYKLKYFSYYLFTVSAFILIDQFITHKFF